MGILRYAGGKPDMAAPVGGILLSSIAEGSIVKLNEGGSPVEFYVAKHDYESALNGSGRTLLVRKDCCEGGKVWDADSYNVYSSSDIDNWLNNTYKGLLDTNVLKVISTTKFYSAKGAQNTNVTSISRSVFCCQWLNTELIIVITAQKVPHYLSQTI